MLRNLIVKINNSLTRLRRRPVSPANLLLLLPHCLQKEACNRKLTTAIDNCEGCGQCDMAAIIRLRNASGIQCQVVGGGRQALAKLKQPQVQAVVAVACTRELVDGIRASFPKPVLAVPLKTPQGPCRDTRVDTAALRSAVREMTQPPA
ncbi:MAG: DUF116 domain-containing protein [Kiritimatiellia bacterium]|nr:DUF116 domain-containing protein [Lentisphaerota bacterium]